MTNKIKRLKMQIIKSVIIILILGITQANAQVIFGIKGGLNVAKVFGKAQGISISSDPLTALHLGITIEKPIADNFSVEPGLFYSQKGAVNYDNEEGVKFVAKRNYIELPVNIAYKYALQSAPVNLVGYAGPFLGYLIAAPETTIGGEADESFYGNDLSYLNKLEYGLNIGVGVEIRQLTISAQYGIGTSNVVNFQKLAKDAELDMSDFVGAKSVNRVFGISLGYKFVRY